MLRQTVLGSGYDPHRHQIPRYPGPTPPHPCLPLLSPGAHSLTSSSHPVAVTASCRAPLSGQPAPLDSQPEAELLCLQVQCLFFPCWSGQSSAHRAGFAHWTSPESHEDRLELPVEVMLWHLLMCKGGQLLPCLSSAQLCLPQIGKQPGQRGYRPPLLHLTRSCARRAPKSNPEEGSFLYTLPDDSTHQLPQPSQDCHHLQEQSAATGQRGMNNGPRSPGLEAVWDPLFHPGQCQGQGGETLQAGVM